MRTNSVLAIVAGALLALSAWSYVDSTSRAERFARGQRFLPNLNPDEVAGIFLEEGESSTRLVRQEDRFVLPGEHGYPARNEAVNRFLRDLLQIELEQEVGVGDELTGELGLGAEAEQATTVTLLDGSEREMVAFRFAAAPGDVGGTYLVRTDGEEEPIYRTSNRVHLQTDADSFLDQQILDVETDEILAIRGPDFAFERAVDEETGEATGDLELVGLESGQSTTSRANQVKSILRGLRFQEHHLADAEEVRELEFDRGLDVLLKDGSGYRLEVARKGEDEDFLRVRGTFDQAPKSIAIDADEEEVRETSEKLTRQDEIRDFNAFHGSWIYEITEITAEKIRASRDELVEDE